MFSGNEWIVVLVVIILAPVIVAMLVPGINGRGRVGVVSPRPTLVPGEPDEVLTDLQLALAGLKATTLRATWWCGHTRALKGAHLGDRRRYPLLSHRTRRAGCPHRRDRNHCRHRGRAWYYESADGGAFRSDAVNAVNGVIRARS